MGFGTFSSSLINFIKFISPYFLRLTQLYFLLYEMQIKTGHYFIVKFKTPIWIKTLQITSPYGLTRLSHNKPLRTRKNSIKPLKWQMLTNIKENLHLKEKTTSLRCPLPNASRISSSPSTKSATCTNSTIVPNLPLSRPASFLAKVKLGKTHASLQFSKPKETSSKWKKSQNHLGSPFKAKIPTDRPSLLTQVKSQGYFSRKINTGMVWIALK